MANNTRSIQTAWSAFKQNRRIERLRIFQRDSQQHVGLLNPTYLPSDHRTRHHQRLHT